MFLMNMIDATLCMKMIGLKVTLLEWLDGRISTRNSKWAIEHLYTFVGILVIMGQNPTQLEELS